MSEEEKFLNFLYEQDLSIMQYINLTKEHTENLEDQISRITTVLDDIERETLKIRHALKQVGQTTALKWE